MFTVASRGTVLARTVTDAAAGSYLAQVPGKSGAVCLRVWLYRGLRQGHEELVHLLTW